MSTRVPDGQRMAPISNMFSMARDFTTARPALRRRTAQLPEGHGILRGKARTAGLRPWPCPDLLPPNEPARR